MNIYDALTKEAQFTCEILCAGITQIRKANYAGRGIYFQAFTACPQDMKESASYAFY